MVPPCRTRLVRLILGVGLARCRMDRAGCDHETDEPANVDPGGRLPRPFPKPGGQPKVPSLGVRTAGG
jgi:hypothetical protein